MFENSEGSTDVRCDIQTKIAKRETDKKNLSYGMSDKFSNDVCGHRLSRIPNVDSDRAE